MPLSQAQTKVRKISGVILGATAAIVLAIILLILLIADMACYLDYYHLPPMPAFIDGTAPLIAVTVFSEIVVAMIV